MKVSILITYYNQQHYVSRSLSSALRQKTSHDFEILVGDDGSTDGTVDEVKKFMLAHPDKIRLFQMPRESGDESLTVERISDNRYNLLKQAKGEYFCYLDGDDFYSDENFIEMSVRLLDLHPDYSGCASSFIKYYEKKQELLRTALPPDIDIIKPEVYIKNRLYLHIGGILFNKKFVDEGAAYLAAKRAFDDSTITHYMLTRGNFIYTKAETYVYVDDATDGCWSGASQAMRHFTNAHRFKFAKRAAPKPMKEFFHSLFRQDLQYLYNNKENIETLLGPEFVEKYSRFDRGRLNYFVYYLLNWNKLNEHKKNLCYRYYKQFRMPRKTASANN